MITIPDSAAAAAVVSAAIAAVVVLVDTVVVAPSSVAVGVAVGLGSFTPVAAVVVVPAVVGTTHQCRRTIVQRLTW